MVFVAALFMNIMDITIVNVALPTIGREFAVPPASLDAVSVGFLVSLAVFIPASGWLGDRFGTKRVLLTAIGVFTLASALCGLATSFSELVAFRVLQGVGGGMLTPVGMAMLFRVFPPEERVRASSILLIPTAFAPAIGPVLGGALVDTLSWRWVFFVNLPIGLAAMVFGLRFVPEHREAQPGRFDLPGFLLAGAGFGLFMYGVSEGPGKGWGSTQVLASIVIGAVLLVILLAVELRTREPLLTLRLYGDRLFRSCNLVVVLTTAGFLGALYVVALFYQDGLGLSALNSGLSTAPEAVGVMIGAQVSSRLLYPAYGPRRLIGAGLLGVAAMLSMLMFVGHGTNLWWARLILFGLGLAISQVFVPLQAAAFASTSSAATGRASTLFNAQRQLGGALGVAILSSVIAAVAAGGGRAAAAGSLRGYHFAFLTAAGLAVLASLFALTIHDSDAAATIVARRKRAPRRASAPERLPVPVSEPV